MILSPLSNGLIEAVNRFQGGSQLINERLRHEGMGNEDPLVRRQGPGPFDGLKPLVDALLTPQVMLTKELLQCATPGELGRFERRPLSQKVAKQPRFLIGEPLENLRKIIRQSIGQSICDSNAVRHHATTMCNQLASGAHLSTLGRQRLELIPVAKSQCKLKLGIGGIVLGPTRGKGLAIFRQHHRINVKEHQAIIFA